MQAISKIERAENAQDLSRILNDDLLGLLDDPLTFAQPVSPLSSAESHRDRSACLPSSGSSIVRKALPGRKDVGLIAATDPNGLRRKRFVQEMNHVLETMGNVTSLVLDLRWRSVFEIQLPY